MSEQVRLKKCGCCKELKPATTVYFYPHARWGLQSECKLCTIKKSKEANRLRALNNPKKVKPKEERRPAETPLELAIEAFLAGRKNLAPGTLDNYQRSLWKFAEDHPEFPPSPQGVTDFLAAGGFSETTKQTVFTAIRTFVNWLRKTKRVEGDPLEGVVRPRGVDLLPRAPKEKDVKRVLDYLESKVEQALQAEPLQAYRTIRDLALYGLLLDTGLRISEACNLDLSDIDLEEGSALIRNTKTRKERYVMFGKTAKGNLKLWLSIREELGIPDNLKALFVTEWGGWQRYGATTFKRQLGRYCQTNNVTGFSPHKLRHFAAVQSLNNGQNLERLRQQLGHSDIKMTSRYFRMPNSGRAEDHLRTSPLDHLGGPA